MSGDNAGARPFLWRAELGRLGVVPAGPVFSFSYLDLGRAITGVAQVLNMAGIAAAFVPSDNPEAGTIRKVLAFIPRLAPAVRSLAFLGGMASTVSFDARRGVLFSLDTLEVPATEGEAPPPPSQAAGEGREAF